MADLPADQLATLVQIANMYYKDNLSQLEIAIQLGVSRSLIATYLQRAGEQQLVRIVIVDPRDDSANLALKLRQKYNIENAILVPFGHKSDELTRRAVATDTGHDCLYRRRLHALADIKRGRWRSLCESLQSTGRDSGNAVDRLPDRCRGRTIARYALPHRHRVRHRKSECRHRRVAHWAHHAPRRRYAAGGRHHAKRVTNHSVANLS